MVTVETQNAIRRNRHRTTMLLVGFPFVLPAIVALAALAVLLLLGRPNALAMAGQTLLVGSAVMGGLTLIWLPVGYLVNQWVVDKATGARLLARSETPRLWTLLEQLCRRADMRLPALRLIESDVLNAYASGLREGQYSITLTRGLLESLNDEELEAVLGHELSHIRNHDVRLLVVALVLVGIVPMLHDILMKAYWAIIHGLLAIYRAIFTLLPLPFGKALLELSYGGLYWVGRLMAYGIGAVATTASLLIHFAISREREFMADAGAAELTGNPQAMISALRRISGRSTLETSLEGVRAMCIDNAVFGFAGLFATHPSIEQRIAALMQLRPVPQRKAGTPVNIETVQRVVEPVAKESEASTRPMADPAMVARYRALICGGHPERYDKEGRLAMYERLRHAVRHARERGIALDDVQAAQAALSLDRAIEAVEQELLAGPG